MPLVKSWACLAAEEIAEQCGRDCGSSLDEMITIIEKHCPFKNTPPRPSQETALYELANKIKRR